MPCVSVTTEAPSTNFVGGEGVADLHYNCSEKRECPVTAWVHTSLFPVYPVCWTILESKRWLSTNIPLTAFFFFAQSFKRMWYLEGLYLEVSGSAGCLCSVGTSLLMGVPVWVPSGPAVSWGKGKAEERQADPGSDNHTALWGTHLGVCCSVLGHCQTWTVPCGVDGMSLCYHP